MAEAELRSWQQVQVHFGSSIANICRSMQAPAIAQVFQRDSICVRGFDLVSGGDPRCSLQPVEIVAGIGEH